MAEVRTRRGGAEARTGRGSAEVRTGRESVEEILVGQFADVAGARTHWLDAGSGRAVLLLHGAGGLGQEVLGAFARQGGARWIAPDRPGYGLSDPLPEGRADPVGTADWAAGLLGALGIARARIVAHSLAAGAALWLAARHPGLVERLVLVSPFCRPTPHRLMPGLRLATAPVIGPPVRRWVVPALLPLVRQRLLAAIAAPAPVPAWLDGFPVSHAARPRAIETIAAELRAFNDGMAPLARVAPLTAPVLAVCGERDGTAEAAWHLPWLRERVVALRVRHVRGAGHGLHHARPALVAGLAAAGLPQADLRARAAAR